MNEENKSGPKNLPKIRTMQSDAGIIKEEEVETKIETPISNFESLQNIPKENTEIPKSTTNTEQNTTVNIETPKIQQPEEKITTPKINELSRIPTPLPKNEITQEPKRAPQSLRTFSDDLSSALRKTQGSIISIAIQEEERRNQEEPKKEKRDSSILVISIGLITLAIIVLFFVLTDKKIPFISQPEIENSSENFLFPISTDGVKKVSLDGKTNESIVLEIQNYINNTEDGITGIVFTKTFGQTNKVLSTSEFASFFEIKMPGELIRNINQSFLYGTIKKENASPIFVFTAGSFEEALSGMLMWENTLILDLFSFLNIDKKDLGDQNFSFEDLVIENKDARVLNLQNNKKVFYLIYPDGTIFIGTDEKAVSEVTEKISIERLK